MSAFHVGDRALYFREPVLVKRVPGSAAHCIDVEDEYGMTLTVPETWLEPVGYRATVDRDEPDEDEPDLNREGDPAFNGAFTKW